MAFTWFLHLRARDDQKLVLRLPVCSSEQEACSSNVAEEADDRSYVVEEPDEPEVELQLSEELRKYMERMKNEPLLPRRPKTTGTELVLFSPSSDINSRISEVLDEDVEFDEVGAFAPPADLPVPTHFSPVPEAGLPLQVPADDLMEID